MPAPVNATTLSARRQINPSERPRSDIRRTSRHALLDPAASDLAPRPLKSRVVHDRHRSACLARPRARNSAIPTRGRRPMDERNLGLGPAHLWSDLAATTSAAVSDLARIARRHRRRASTRASRCSTPPTCTAIAAARRPCWARCSARAARTSCWPASSAADGRPRPPEVGGSRRYVMQAVEDSLRRLKTDWIDLYQFHSPDPRRRSRRRCARSTISSRQGKVRYIGCSNQVAWEVADASWTAETEGLTPFVSARTSTPCCSASRGGAHPRHAPLRARAPAVFPLASGLLTGKYRKDAEPAAGTRFAGSQMSRTAT